MFCKNCKPRFESNPWPKRLPDGVTTEDPAVMLCPVHELTEMLAETARHYRTMHKDACVCVYCETLKEYDAAKGIS